MSYNLKFNDECLVAHNAFRNLHHASDLKLSPDLAQAAQAWAQHLAETGRLQHCPDNDSKFGENLAVRWTSSKADFNGQQVTEQWYSEIAQYKFDEENQLNCGHFSQVVWRKSKEAGFGKAVAASGKIYVVGRYYPPGNFINEWRDNVLPPLPDEGLSNSEETSNFNDMSNVDQEFNRECIDYHNELRENHDAPPLEYDEQLALSAQSWANELAAIGALEHSPESEGKVGENVGMKWSSRGADISGVKATQQWYSERKQYDYDKENQLNCGHFSQVVWRSTKRAGFGKATGEDGKVFVVGQYHPPGNYRNRWRENVRRPKDDPEQGDRDLQPPKHGDRDRSRSPRREVKEYNSEELDVFNDECLDSHNQLRSKHHAPSLKLSNRLMTSAQRWSEHLAQLGSLQHSPESGTKLGENVGMKWSSRGTDITGEQATSQWYSEVKNYDFSRENQLNCGHFSQVVWCGSREVGFGKMRSDSGKIFVVAHYHPPGNYRDQWRQNVLPIEGDFDGPERPSRDADKASLDLDFKRSSSPSRPWEDKYGKADRDLDYRRSSSPSKPWDEKRDLDQKPHEMSRPMSPPERDYPVGVCEPIEEEEPIEEKHTKGVHALKTTPEESEKEEEPKGSDQLEGSMASRSRYAKENGAAGEETITAKKSPKIERSPTPTHPDDKFFFGPKENKDQIVSRKLMRRYIDANRVLLTTAEVYERPNKSRYVITGFAREMVSGQAVY